MYLNKLKPYKQELFRVLIYLKENPAKGETLQ